jgi:predicted DsbA family dithiol-disulfide isomerase
MTLEQVTAMHERMTALAAAEGLEYHLDETQGGNTFDAHRLLQLAKSRGIGGEMKERLLRAYFTECDPIGERDVLVRLGEEMGLADAAEVLASDAFAREVRADEHEAGLFGINGVPFFVVDRYYAVEGAQPAEVLLDALTRAVSPGTPQVA